jgi:hypothetical protein
MIRPAALGNGRACGRSWVGGLIDDLAEVVREALGKIDVRTLPFLGALSGPGPQVGCSTAQRTGTTRAGSNLDVLRLERDRFTPAQPSPVAQSMAIAPRRCPKASKASNRASHCSSVGRAERGTYADVVPWMVAVLAWQTIHMGSSLWAISHATGGRG